jgi:long-chain acyl-CoA synthetase
VVDRVRSIGAALRSYGVERGDRVGLLSENVPEWAWIDYAILCTGAVTVPVYPTLPSNQAAYIVRTPAAHAVRIFGEQLEKVLEARAELPDLERIIVIDEVAGTERACCRSRPCSRPVGGRVERRGIP